MLMWTLVVFVAAGGPSIVIDGFSRLDDCREAGRLNVEYINPAARYRCDKTDRPPTICKRDTRTYGRGAECLQ